MKKTLILLSTLITGVIAVFWTSAGQTSDPVLAMREIPVQVINSCAASSAGGLEACQPSEFSRRWVGRTGHGDLFLVTNDLCTETGCHAWLVEKNTGIATILLTFDSSFRLHQDPDGYPVIESYSEISATEGAYSRFEWNGAGYTRTANRLVYLVDGKECGTREECSLQADKALKRQQVDRAVRIWQDVHGVSWI
ncbi:MAG: hypothetical protein ACYC9J_12295 [Sulfuricaulis sp.]